VARFSTAVLGESRVGAIVTSGDPTGLSHNQVAGVDFHYRRSDFRPGKRLEATIYAQRSYSNVRPDDNAFGLGIEYPNDPWKASFKAKQIGKDFRPALGFVNRPGVRVYEAEVHRFWRRKAAWARIVDVSGSELVVTDLDGRLESRNDHLGFEIETRDNAKFSAGVDNAVEVIDTPFLLASTVLVPRGRYDFARGFASYETSTTRPLTVSWKLVCCSYFGGRSTESELQLSYRPGPRFNLVFKHQLQPIHLPTGNTTIHIESLNATINFTPDMRLVNEFQYDNVSQRFSGSLRFRWEILPTTELLVTLGESALMSGELPRTRYHSQATVVSVRMGHRFQF
jgi:hypothetical protein